MKIIEAISAIDALKQNTYTQSETVACLSNVDSKVKRLIIDTHEGGEDVTFTGYNDTTDLETELLVPAPFDEVYLRWLEAMIDYNNGEYGKYNNSINMYNTAYEGFQNHYNRTHMPKGERNKYFQGRG